MVDYETFRKAFYHPPLEVELLTVEEVEEMRIEMDGIKVRGADPPKPVSKWSYCGLPATASVFSTARFSIFTWTDSNLIGLK